MAIELFSKPGELILDPYMGGGTSLVEGVVAGRNVVGNDLNSLASFVAKVKTTRLTKNEVCAVRGWITEQVPLLSYRWPISSIAPFIDDRKTRNMSMLRARFIKKTIACGLATIADLPTESARNLAKCALLQVGQWALDGRKRHTPLSSFRQRLVDTTEEMLTRIQELGDRIRRSGGRAIIYNVDAADLPELSFFTHRRASMVVTSPPYPGVHVLYHRWQVNGRRETPAPYWIAGCEDGQGASFYNFGDRRHELVHSYFRSLLLTLQGIRKVMKTGGYMVQMVAFNRPSEQLPRYLENMSLAGFAEVSGPSSDRIWREVPNRKWHATLQGQTQAAREVVLVHRAV